MASLPFTDDLGFIFAFSMYSISLFIWFAMELEVWIQRKKGIDIEEGLEIATTLDTKVAKQWLLYIFIGNLLVIPISIQLADGTTRGTIVNDAAMMTCIGGVILAGWLNSRLPDLRGTKDWSATVAMGFLSSMSCLVLILSAFLAFEKISLFQEAGTPIGYDVNFYAMPFLLPLVSSLVAVVFSFKLMAAVSTERVEMMKAKFGDDEANIRDEKRHGSEVEIEQKSVMQLPQESMIAKRWLLIILAGNTLSALLIFLMVGWSEIGMLIPQAERNTELVSLTLWPCLAAAILAGWSINLLPDLKQGMGWYATVSMSFLTTIACTPVVFTILIVYNSDTTDFGALFLPLLSSIVSVVFSFKLLSAVQKQRTGMIREKLKPEETSVSDEVKEEKPEDDYSEHDLAVSEATWVALVMSIPIIMIFAALVFFGILPWILSLLVCAFSLFILALLVAIKPTAILMVGRPLYRHDYRTTIPSEKVIPDLGNFDLESKGGEQVELFEPKLD